jgi:hypothetical protein
MGMMKIFANAAISERTMQGVPASAFLPRTRIMTAMTLMGTMGRVTAMNFGWPNPQELVIAAAKFVSFPA